MLASYLEECISRYKDEVASLQSKPTDSWRERDHVNYTIYLGSIATLYKTWAYDEYPDPDVAEASDKYKEYLNYTQKYKEAELALNSYKGEW